MLEKTLNFVAVLLICLLSLAASAQRASAQSYQIDCAILLCLSGGWPSSAPCSRARAEFIRRITPWPIEPPLQIWRCPMGASYSTDPVSRSLPQLFEAHFEFISPTDQSTSTPDHQVSITAQLRTLGLAQQEATDLSTRLALRLVQDRADIDISGPEFNFVRSIRVFDVRYARQRESGRDGDCNRSALVQLGTYGTQGDFSWQRSSTSALPPAHIGLERWGQNCPSIYHRSVFVDWRDYEGNYGFEQVNY